MSKELEEAIEILDKFKTIKILYGNTYAMLLEDLEKLQQAIETVLNYIEILETAVNNKYPYVIGGRTLYAKLQQYNKEDLIKAYLSLRNETEQLIEENENSIPKKKIEEKIKENKINIAGLEIVIVKDLQELLEEK